MYNNISYSQANLFNIQIMIKENLEQLNWEIQVALRNAIREILFEENSA